MDAGMGIVVNKILIDLLEGECLLHKDDCIYIPPIEKCADEPSARHI